MYKHVVQTNIILMSRAQDCLLYHLNLFLPLFFAHSHLHSHPYDSYFFFVTNKRESLKLTLNKCKSLSRLSPRYALGVINLNLHGCSFTSFTETSHWLQPAPGTLVRLRLPRPSTSLYLHLLRSSRMTRQEMEYPPLSDVEQKKRKATLERAKAAYVSQTSLFLSSHNLGSN